MAVKTVHVYINGKHYILAFYPTTGYWEGAITAPTVSSWNLTNHKYGMTVLAEDEAGNTKQVDRNDSTFGSTLELRVLETEKPIVELIAPASGAFVTSSKPRIQIIVKDKIGGSGVNKNNIVIKIDGYATYPWKNESITFDSVDGYNSATLTYEPETALSEGAHRIEVYCADYDGNFSDTKVADFKVDTVPPSLNVSSPAKDAWLNSTTVTISGTTNDATSSPVTIEAALNVSPKQTITVEPDGSFSAELTGGVEGDNILSVTATDSAGKTTTLTRAFKIDTKAPTIEEITVTPNPVNVGATYTIRVKASDI